MYLQITTRCNMTCAHCGFSCRKGAGKHMEWGTFIDAARFIEGYTEFLFIGGGEPTMHPRFFDMLHFAFNATYFTDVGMVTNGSFTNKMFRLADIINMEDDELWQEGKLYVDLSTDPWHDPIDERVMDLWKRMTIDKVFGFGTRDSSTARDGLINAGRAKRNQMAWDNSRCVCDDIIIKPDGTIKPCGCARAPVIGNIWDGIDEHWQTVTDSDAFRDYQCYTMWRNHTRS